MSFFDRVAARVTALDSMLCVGLDPAPADVPTITALGDYCARLVDATAALAAAFKPNLAFFECHGPTGVAVLEALVRQLREAGMPVILDAKRGDISSTAQAQAETLFGRFGADAVTLNPLLGRDGVAPFVTDAFADRGVFVLCRTSNPSADALQALLVHGRDGHRRPLFEEIARQAPGWSPHANVGLVAGATRPDDLARVRVLAPASWLLAPGVGAQGGDAALAVEAGLRDDGLGLLVPVSRAIAHAADPAEAARTLVERLRAARDAVLAAGPRQAPAPGPTHSADADRRALAADLVESGCVRFGEFTLKSGLTSPIYLDLRQLAGAPAVLARVAAAFDRLLDRLEYTRLAALPYAALPIATAIALRRGEPVIYPRRETKDYGTRAAIEGPWSAGERVVVVDDLTTTGSSKVEALERLTAAGLVVQDVAVLIDRESGAREALAALGLNLHAVFTLRELLALWRTSGTVDAQHLEATERFLGSGALA